MSYADSNYTCEGMYEIADELEQENEKLKADVAMLRDVCVDADAVFQSSRVWGGMEFVLHPIHPFKYKRTAENMRTALDLLHSGSDAWLNEQKAKALEDAAKYFESVNDQFINPDRCVEKTLFRMAAELRSQSMEHSNE